MEAKGFRRRVQWQILNVLNILVKSVGFGLSIGSRNREFVANIQYTRVNVDLDNVFDQPDILVIGDSVAIVDLGSQEIQDLVGDLFVLVQQHSELLLANH